MTTASTAILKEVEGIEFHNRFFVEGIYEDGRELNEERPFLVKVGLDKTASGSSYVQYQGSTVSCRINAKAGYVDPRQCLRFKYEQANDIPKKELDFVKGILNEFSRTHVFVNPKSLIFDTEYQVQLIVTLTVNTCDGFIMGAALTAINCALFNTRIPKMSASDAEENQMDDGSKLIQYIRKRNRFHVDMDNMRSLEINDILYYAGFLIHSNPEGEDLFLYDPNEEIMRLVRPRVDIIIGSDCSIHYWQNANFDDGMQPELRRKVFELAKERADRMKEILDILICTERASSSNRVSLIRIESQRLFASDPSKPPTKAVDRQRTRSVLEEVLIREEEQPKTTAQKVKKKAENTFLYIVVVASAATFAGFAWLLFDTFFGATSPNRIYSKSLKLICADEECQHQLGDKISGFGEQGRRSRRQIANQKYMKGDEERILVVYHVKGSKSAGRAMVEMVKKPGESWDYRFLAVETVDHRRIFVIDNRKAHAPAQSEEVKNIFTESS